MNPWLLASILLGCGLMVCAFACLRCEPAAALAALSVATSVGVLLMVTLTEAFGRQPFMDLAVVLGPVGIVGSLAFVRFLERRE
jgi:multisubunit Na+/H+ antiporter MnhF subunit